MFYERMYRDTEGKSIRKGTFFLLGAILHPGLWSYAANLKSSETTITAFGSGVSDTTLRVTICQPIRAHMQ